MFGDDGYEKTKRALLKRVADETRSFPIIDVDYYLYREAASLARNEELALKFKETEHKPKFLRCKIAYKDLSKDKREPVMIRTRYIASSAYFYVENPTSFFSYLLNNNLSIF